MKRLMVMLLALAMALGCAATAFALNDEDYDNQDIFYVKEEVKTLYPGVDYYFDCDWQGGDITDDFFEFYEVSVSVSEADDDNVNTLTAKKIAEAAEFVKVDGQDKYYFHFRAKKSYDYPDDDVTILVTVMAKDKARDKDMRDSRSWYQFELDIGYADKNDPRVVVKEDYEVDNDQPIVEFDEDLDYCMLTFEDGSYYSVYLDKVREFNLGQSTDENKAITDAYPGATLKFVSFYSKPKFASASVLKIYAPGCKYLYEIGNNNRLYLLADESNGGYIGVSTDELVSYVASSVPLDSAAVNTNDGSYSNANVTGPAASSQPAAAPSAPSAPVITNPNTGAS